MKVIYEHELGGDGGTAGAYLNEGKMMVTMSYPVAKMMEPLMAPLDAFEQKLLAMAPDMVDPLIHEGFKAMKEAMMKMMMP